jgi:CubicO group peptidase (beta-lactamase class C family)
MTLLATRDVAGMSAERLGRIGVAMQHLVDAGQVAGVVSLVVRRGETIHFEARGVLDLASRRPMQTDSIFRIFSMTKPVTAAAVMLVLEEGKLLIDDPIADYLPEFSQTRVCIRETANGLQLADLDRPITVRHLLTHTSGLTYPQAVSASWEPDSIVARLYTTAGVMRGDEPLAEKVPRLARLPLVHQPGAGWNYGMSIDVLGRLVEVLSGQTFGAFLRQRLFEPLGMVSSGFYVDADKLDRLATGYTYGERGLEPIVGGLLADVSRPPRFEMPGGGLVSTAMDYARFAQMLVNGGALDGARVLGPKTVELMLSSQMTRDQVPFVPRTWPFREGYGMAFGGRTLIDVAASGLPGTLGSYTWQGAWNTDFWADPREQLVGVVMLQRVGGYARPGELMRVLTYQALMD